MESTENNCNRCQELNREVHDLSVALKTILNSYESEKRAYKKNISTFVETSILPLLYELKKKSRNDQRIEVIINGLNQLIDSQTKKIFFIQNGLTAREIEISYQLAQGIKGKDIANNLNISYVTLRTHTKNIRRKLGLKRWQNVSLYLQEQLTVRD